MSTAERTVTTAPGLEPEAALAATPRLAWRARWRDAALIVSGADLIALLVAQCAALALTADLFTDQRARLGEPRPGRRRVLRALARAAGRLRDL